MNLWKGTFSYKLTRWQHFTFGEWQPREIINKKSREINRRKHVIEMGKSSEYHSIELSLNKSDDIQESIHVVCSEMIQLFNSSKKK